MAGGLVAHVVDFARAPGPTNRGAIAWFVLVVASYAAVIPFVLTLDVMFGPKPT